jgi:hypothetical protein
MPPCLTVLPDSGGQTTVETKLLELQTRTTIVAQHERDLAEAQASLADLTRERVSALQCFAESYSGLSFVSRSLSACMGYACACLF